MVVDIDTNNVGSDKNHTCFVESRDEILRYKAILQVLLSS